MKTKLTLTAIIGFGVALLSGCASVSKHDLSAMQGTWVGHETRNPSAECHMTIAGNVLKFTGPEPSVWYNAKLTLDQNTAPKRADIFIEDCCEPKYNQKIARAIYRIEGTTFTLASNEPGSESVPAGFEGGEARVFVFSRQ